MILTSGARGSGLNSRSSPASACEHSARRSERNPFATRRWGASLRPACVCYSSSGEDMASWATLPLTASDCLPPALARGAGPRPACAAVARTRPRPLRPECCCRHRQAAIGNRRPPPRPASFARRPLPRSLPVLLPTAEYLRRPTGSLRATVGYLSPLVASCRPPATTERQARCQSGFLLPPVSKLLPAQASSAPGGQARNPSSPACISSSPLGVVLGTPPLPRNRAERFKLNASLASSSQHAPLA